VLPPTCWFFWGLFPLGPRLLLFPFFPLFLHYSVDGPYFPYLVVKNFEIDDWERVEKS
jgi:hypothetical protein